MNNPKLFSKDGSLPVEKNRLSEPYNIFSDDELVSTYGYTIKPWPPAIGPEQLLAWTGERWLVIDNPDYSPSTFVSTLPPVPPENK